MPLVTCEMRWFFEGALPDDAERWLQTGQRPAEAWREDRYLLLPDIADMGIKERDGRLEVKGRLAKLGRQVIASGMEGNAERWCKWSYGMPLAERFRSHDAVVVGKGRTQRHFLLKSRRRVLETAQRDVSRRGFSVELTRIRLAEAHHWSLGVEAAPDDADLLDDLLRALRDILQDFPLPLPQASSRSYPRWLLDRGYAASRTD